MKNLVGKAKSEFDVKKIEDSEGDQRKLCSVIDGLMGRNKPTVFLLLQVITYWQGP